MNAVDVVTVAEFHYESEALLMQGLLEANGILSVLVAENAIPIGRSALFGARPLLSQSIQVRADQADYARALIRDAERGELALQEDQPPTGTEHNASEPAAARRWIAIFLLAYTTINVFLFMMAEAFDLSFDALEENRYWVCFVLAGLYTCAQSMYEIHRRDRQTAQTKNEIAGDS